MDVRYSCLLVPARGDQVVAISRLLLCRTLFLLLFRFFLSWNASFYRRGETDSVNCLFTLALDSEGGQGRDISSSA